LIISDLLASGGMETGLKEKGKIQLEGRDYLVKDRDVIEFKVGSWYTFPRTFNVLTYINMIDYELTLVLPGSATAAKTKSAQEAIEKIDQEIASRPRVATFTDRYWWEKLNRKTLVANLERVKKTIIRKL